MIDYYVCDHKEFITLINQLKFKDNLCVISFLFLYLWRLLWQLLGQLLAQQVLPRQEGEVVERNSTS